MRFFVRTSAALLFLCVFAFPSAAKEAKDTTPAPYTDDEFPQFMKDLRRAEIISFGALPFVTLSSTIVYSGVRYWQHGFDSEYFPNPFAKASASNGYSTREQAGILLTSAGISVGIGLTDLLISVIRRKAAKKKLERKEKAPIVVTPISEDKDAVRIDFPPPDRMPPPDFDPPDTALPDEDAENGDAASSSAASENAGAEIPADGQASDFAQADFEEERAFLTDAPYAAALALEAQNGD